MLCGERWRWQVALFSWARKCIYGGLSYWTCGVGLGAVLSQEQEGRSRVIGYASRVLRGAETRYSVTKRELLATVWGVRTFECHLLGRPFIIRSDHEPLQHLKTLHQPRAQVAKWLEVLADFDFQLLHRAGRSHTNADGLSRRPPDIAVVAPPASSSVDWVAEQARDPDLATVLQGLQSDTWPKSLPNGSSPSLRHLFRVRERLLVEDGVLCRRFTPVDEGHSEVL